MARADLLLELVQAALDGNEARVRSVVEAVAAEERQKRHEILAADLGRLLDRSIQSSFKSADVPQSASASGVLEVEPKLRLQDLICLRLFSTNCPQ